LSRCAREEVASDKF